MNFNNPNDWQIWAKSFPLRAAADAKRTSPFTVLEAKDVGGVKTRDVLIYGQIGRDWLSEDGVDAAEFAGILAAIPKNEKPRLRINSPGGNVWEGFAIYNLARERGVETINDGVAASIAAVILCAGPSSSPESASVMIHKCYGMFIGNADAVEEFKAQLDKHDDMQCGVFSKKTGKPAAEIKAMMGKDKWFSGTEAKAFGLIDSLSNTASAPAASAASGLSVTLTAALRGGQQTNENTMNKKILVALLFEHGMKNQTTAKDFTEADADTDFEAGLKALGKKPGLDADARLQAMQAQLDLVLARGADDGAAAMKRIQAQLTREREGRITKALDQMVIDGKMTVDEVKAWKPICLADESDELLAMLDQRSPQLPGSAPAGHITGGGIAVVEEFRKLSAGLERQNFLRANHDGLRQQMIGITRAPQAANTVDSALVTAHLADGLVVIAQNKLAMVNLFSREFGVDVIKPLATVQVKKATAGATGQQDPTNFESGDSTLDNIAVTMHQEALSFQISNADLLNGIRMQDIAEINGEAFANQLSDRFTAVMTTANYGTALTIGTAANFDSADLSPILAVAKNYRRKNLILDGGHLAYITPKTLEAVDYRTASLTLGFDRIAEQNRWTGATANTAGFVCGPDAIGCASGMAPELPAGEFISITNTTLPNGLTVRTAVWFARGGRVMWAAHDIMLGVAPGDTTQAEVLITA